MSSKIKVVDKKLLAYIAKKSKQVRFEKDISQTDALIGTGIHIGRLEQGKRDISVSTLMKMCKFYKMTIGEFLAEYEN